MIQVTTAELYIIIRSLVLDRGSILGIESEGVRECQDYRRGWF